MAPSAVKVALVTGANQGIGFAIVRRLCKEYPNWIVYGTSRSAENGAEAVKKLSEEGLHAQFLCADLTNEKSFVALRDKLQAEHGGLDVLVNNAGIAFKRNATDSYQVKVHVTLATNVHGTNMVCQQLFPILRDGARVVIMTSRLSFAGLSSLKTLNTERYMSYIQEPPLPLDDVLQSMREYECAVAAGDFAEKGWPDDSAYTMSNVACTLMARAMNEEFSKFPERDIVVNAADPGYVSTNMSSYEGPLTTDQGADTPFYLATLPPKTTIKGQQVANREPVQWK